MPREVHELVQDAWSKVSDLNPTRYARLGGSPALQRFVECAYAAIKAQQELLAALASAQAQPPQPPQPPPEQPAATPEQPETKPPEGPEKPATEDDKGQVDSSDARPPDPDEQALGAEVSGTPTEAGQEPSTTPDRPDALSEAV